MSQKIDGGIAAAAQLRSVAINTKVAPAGESKTEAVQAADSVRLTGEATQLQAVQRELSVAPAIDPARVQAVREALENGSYRINADAIASRMLDLDQQLQG
ncbi:flagellar biosynthesis anti-sigma factor FlgM [Stenotrophomonas sp. SY1]|uniref:flagellar biosynthesis anti-sigma factor FlgM n=1 Tax=Stenotrophomonas sp. SY1 TaxID=477235 RepID=UPI001E4A1047|nr:flagellar biosynthesis anti-sigma factor FlgM [Stenotrophomonas sp. SY1]MCD9087130.1 flagellar biosynthesis anti-sigma factor FlgM [Stenotrophomonas sp. SY1]